MNGIKRIRKLTIIMIICLMGVGLLPLTAKAAGSLSISFSDSSITAGETVKTTVEVSGEGGTQASTDMTITYSSDLLEYVSSSDSSSTESDGRITASGSTVTLTFKGIASGRAHIVAEGNGVTAAGAYVTVSGSTATDSDDEDSTVNLSGDNSLKSLSISEGTLSPSFSSATTKYTAKVDSDVTEITVSPVTSNSKAEIKSITGNEDLSEGENIVEITVAAENKSEATYQITVTKASEDTQNESSGSGTDSETESETASTEEMDVTVTGDGIVVGSNSYQISDEFTEEDIPEGFVASEIQYNSEMYQGAIYEKGQIGVLYLVNIADNTDKGFYVYDMNSDSFYPLIRVTVGMSELILMNPTPGNLPPLNYIEADLNYKDIGTIKAFVYDTATANNEEILRESITETTETADTEAVTEAVTEAAATETTSSDTFYLVFAIDETGSMGWYQYDTVQDTFQRLNTQLIPEETDNTSIESLQASLTTLSEKYETLRTNNRRMLVIGIFLFAILIIVIINLILKIRDNRVDPSQKAVTKKDSSRVIGIDEDIYEKIDEDIEEDLKEDLKDEPIESPIESPKESKVERFDDLEEDFEVETDIEEEELQGRPFFRRKKKAEPGSESARLQKNADTKTKQHDKDQVEKTSSEDDDLEILDLNE
ncbi:MAG: cadherin-like beta sandwich domain-containing protein [Lachnospiraceae bacterium]